MKNRHLVNGTKDLTNKKMNSDTYKLRRNVMELIYELKEIAELPRIEVRVAENHNVIRGQAYLERNVIYITDRVTKEGVIGLRRTVYHEVLHAVCGTPHKAGCELMGPCPTGNRPNKKTLQKLFSKYYKGA